MDLFGDEAAPAAASVPTVEQVRARIEAALESLRTSGAWPWSERETARWKLVLPQMADWLPAEERDAARREFARLLEMNAPALAAE